MSFVLDKINSIIRNAINRFGREFEASPDRIALWVEPKGVNLRLFVLLDAKKEKEIQFKELVNSLENIALKGLGFDINSDLPVWFSGMMCRVEVSKKLLFESQRYFIRIYNEKPVMFLFLNGQKVVFDESQLNPNDPLAQYKVPMDFIINNQ